MSTSSDPDSSTKKYGLSCNGNGRSKRRLTECSEAVLRRRIVRAIKTRWPTAWVYHPADRFHSGIPDLLICIPPHGLWLAIEVKRPGESPTPLQRIILRKIRQAGGAAWVIRDPKELHHVYLP